MSSLSTTSTVVKRERPSGESIKRERSEESLDEVTVAEGSSRIWLVKIPKLMHQHWFDSDAMVGSEVGNVTVNNHTQDIKLTMTRPAEGIPQKWNLAIREIPNNMPTKVFTEDGEITFSGKVERKLDMEPFAENAEMADSYRALMRVRSKVSNTKTRQIQTITGTTPDHLMKQSVFNQSNPFYITKKTDRVLDKRDRKDKEVVLDMLFDLFAQKPHWEMKQLVDRTNQPQQYLKELLAEVAVYNKKGPNRQQFELKPEFAHQKPGEGSSSTTSSTR